MYHTNINNSDNEIFQRFTESVSYDKKLFKQDIKGSKAHARMLAKQNIISLNDANEICWGLTQIQEEIINNKFTWKYELEDIHMNIESRLNELIGDIAGKLHTARSRNDQVALDMRLFLKETIINTIILLLELQSTILSRAEENLDIVIPGYTHMQRAQPLLLSHHLMAYFNMFSRDITRFENNYVETDVMPVSYTHLTLPTICSV